jgi:hypothetical protein
LNGTLETTTSIPEALDPEALEGDLYLCGDPGTVVWFNGKIDEVLIVNRALSATEIADLYTRGIHRLDADTGKAAPFFTEDSLYCLLDNMDTKDLPVEAGLAFQDSRIIRTCSEIKQFDRVRVDGELFEVGTIKPKYIGDTLLCYSALIQKLKMEVQGRANPPSGETCTGEASAGASTIDQAHSRRSLHE